MPRPKRQPPLDLDLCLERHLYAQSLPHPVERINRPEKRGQLAERFFLRLTDAKLRNRLRHEKAWQAKEARAFMIKLLRAQLSQEYYTPYEGHPQVLCYRYSDKESDYGSNWSKLAVDCLQPGGVRTITTPKTDAFGRHHNVVRTIRYEGLNVISSDRPADCEVVEVWEPAKRGEGFCVIEVRV